MHLKPSATEPGAGMALGCALAWRGERPLHLACSEGHEATVEARRDALPGARSRTLEYAVHGKFRTREGGVSFPDDVVV